MEAEKNSQRDRDAAIALTKSQDILFEYVFMMLADRHAAEDVLQETNRSILENLDRLDSLDRFLPWAKTVAFFQVKRYRSSVRRENARLVFDDETVEKLAGILSAPDSRETEQREITFDALEQCVEKLPPAKRELIYRHYWKQMPMQRIAEESKSSPSAVKVAMLRIRRELGSCIQKLLCSFDESAATTEEDGLRAELFEAVLEQNSPDSRQMNRRLLTDDDFRDDWLDVASVHAALSFHIHKLHICGAFALCEDAARPGLRSRHAFRWLAFAACCAVVLGGSSLLLRGKWTAAAKSPAAAPGRLPPAAEAPQRETPAALSPQPAKPAVKPLSVLEKMAQNKTPQATESRSLPSREQAPELFVRTPERKAQTCANPQKKENPMKMTSLTTKTLASTVAAVALGAGSALAESEEVAINTSPDRNGRWSAVTTNAVPLAWEWPDGAKTARLTITGKGATVYAKSFSAASGETSTTWQAFSDSVPKAEEEGVYAASMVFYGLDGTTAVQTLSAQLVIARSAFSEAAVIPNPEGRKWGNIYSSFVLLPYDSLWLDSSNAVSSAGLTVSNSVSGSCSSAALTGTEGWTEGTFKNGTLFQTAVQFDGDAEKTLSATLKKVPRGTVVMLL